MGTRQYVGARYVPKFFENSLGTSEWTANTQYEPLTIVTRNGNSYTSKQLVPASVGAPESNSSYWVSTGIYNQQVEEIREALEDLTDRVNHIRDRRFIFIGDSYMAATGLGGVNAGFAALACNALGLTSDQFYISAVNGYGFARPNQQFVTLLSNLIPSVSDPDTITDIVVCGGANDQSYLSGLQAAMAEFKNTALAAFPNAKIYVAMSDWNYTVPFQYHGLVIAYNNAAYANGLGVIDGLYLAGHYDGWKQADQHPNAAGQVELAKMLASWMTGSMVLTKSSQVKATFTAAAHDEWSASSLFNNLFTSIEGNMVTIESIDGENYFNYSTAVTESTRTIKNIELGTLSNTYAFGDQYGNTRCPVCVFLQGSNLSRFEMGYLQFKSDGTVHLLFPVLSGDSYFSVRLYGGCNLTAPYWLL